MADPHDAAQSDETVVASDKTNPFQGGPNAALEPFAFSRAKIERSRAFIAELEHEQEAYRASKPYTATPVLDPGGTTFSIAVEWKSAGLLPGTILGDAIHNMRTALDLLASELAEKNNMSSKNVYFPIADLEKNLEARIKATHFSNAGVDAINLLKELKPYRGGNDRLRAIHDLDICDKHRALIPMVDAHAIKINGFVPTGADISKVEVEVVDEGFAWKFPPDSPFPDRLMVETLHELVEIVHSIVEAFALLVGKTSR